MLPDERITRLLEEVDVHARPDSLFLDTLFDRLVAERRQRRTSIVTAPSALRPAMRFLPAAAAVVVVALAGILFLGTRGGPGQGASPSIVPPPTASVARSNEPSPTPSNSPTPRALPSPTTAADAAVAALDAVDHAITAARGPVGLTVDDQNRLLQLEDDIRARLGTGDVVTARTPFDQMVAYVGTLGSKLDSDAGTRLRTTLSALDQLLPKP